MLFALLIGFDPAARSQVYEGRELVKAKLLADTDAVVPGKAFTAGLLLHMVPAWHTYWKFPGDAGIPTEMKWNLPADWKVGPIQWPIPLKLNEPGDIQIYGYHDEVLLMQQITPPASRAGKTVRLKADASWLVCEKICIPGNATLQLDLPVGTQSAPANQELFARYQRALPQPWPDAKVASYNWQRSGANLILTLNSQALSNYASVEFFPLPEGNIVVGHPKTESIANGKVQIRVPLESQEAKITSLNGLVVFGRTENGTDRNAWSLNTGAAMADARSAASSNAPQSVFKLLLFGFLGGFILNLMPCVLPVISLKIFGFVRHAGDSRRRILRSGLAFIAGIFAWFIGLALVLVVLKSAGHELTWALQFTNPYFVLVMSAVVLVFALNLFGVFEISLPQSATASLMDVTAREGDAGSFFQGVFATVLATPCTAPYLGTALGFAFTQSSAMILVMFAAIAAGMSAPYLLLSAQPAWLRFLPKPGPWMVQRQTADGLSSPRHAPISSFRSRRRTRRERRHLDVGVSARSQSCLLDERPISFAYNIAPDARRRARAHARARNRQRLLFHRPKISRCSTLRGRNAIARRLATIHARTFAGRTGAGSFRLRRFHRRLVYHLQIQRSDRSRKRRRARRISAQRHREIESRLDERRSGDHKNFETIWPPGCPILRALPGGRISHHISGVAHQEYLA